MWMGVFDRIGVYLVTSKADGRVSAVEGENLAEVIKVMYRGNESQRYK
jgi:hypothetical protein